MILETVIGLMIVCSLITISVINFNNYRAHVEEKQALEWFKGSFKNTMNYAYLNNKSASMKVEANRIDFLYTDIHGKRIDHKKKFPKTLTIVNAPVDYFIGRSGQSGPRTVIIHSKLSNEDYKYVIQLGWGEIVESKT
ncbi:hypothetical protein LAL01_14980 [Companilactobacillus alimentarius]|uniref:Competence protein ComGD n=2 Tax=Companilactobacillus alimentarius TaxID=1602 RepID=A0A2K9HE00_9LACO|nr:hypothetical protein LA20249_00550 [Companilactobacillus alimentarius DSM 20249]KRK77642.1 hypothetical protein FC67_GL000235 [Companilactobacillus alimentarius DSM 20249]GEO45266.1 hypothetical protein LAL01_14980 [Companilactobacillus alimentarius]